MRCRTNQLTPNCSMADSIYWCLPAGYNANRVFDRITALFYRCACLLGDTPFCGCRHHTLAGFSDTLRDRKTHMIRRSVNSPPVRQHPVVHHILILFIGGIPNSRSFAADRKTGGRFAVDTKHCFPCKADLYNMLCPPRDKGVSPINSASPSNENSITSSDRQHIIKHRQRSARQPRHIRAVDSNWVV
jgi:hypothetical protein